METMSIKALALKALHGNQHGNKMETSSFQERKFTDQIPMDGNLPERAEGAEIPYTIFYSGFLKDCFLFTKSDRDAQELRDSGILDVVYSHREVKELVGLPPESIKAHHLIKKSFLKSTIETGEGKHHGSSKPH
jgi:hypothetical protein